MLPVVVVYTGIVTIVVALIALIRPIRSLRLAPRKRGGALLVAGAALVAAGMALPSAEVRVAAPASRLDEYMPAYQFNEVHTIRVNASPARVYRAIKEVTAGDISFFRALTAIRRFGRPAPESILNAPERLPILDVATRTTFVTLADDAEREIVVGTVVMAPPNTLTGQPRTPEAYRAVTGPGFALAAMNFLIVPNDSLSTIVSTETRVYATDGASQRRFARYWRVIYPGSALIRRSWLRAIRRRASA